MDFNYVCIVTLIGNMTLGQGHDTPFGYGQQLCEILSISVKGLGSYGLDKVDSQTDRQTG